MTPTVSQFVGGWVRIQSLCLLGVTEGLLAYLTVYIGICSTRVGILLLRDVVIKTCTSVIVAIKVDSILVGRFLRVLGYAQLLCLVQRGVSV